jgi:hypothetical protein
MDDFRPEGRAVSKPIQQSSSTRPAPNQSRKGRKNPEPGTGVPGKQTKVLRMVLRGAFSQVAIGLAIGIPAAIGAGKLMTQQLFSVRP